MGPDDSHRTRAEKPQKAGSGEKHTGKAISKLVILGTRRYVEAQSRRTLKHVLWWYWKIGDDHMAAHGRRASLTGLAITGALFYFVVVY